MRRRELHATRNSEKHAIKRREAMERAPFQERAKMMRQGMRERSRNAGIPFDADTLTTAYLLEWLRQQPDCPCCNRPFDVGWKRDHVGPNDRSPSIDRIRPIDGYVVGNVALICWRCNNLKRDATADELFGIVRWMWSVGL
jgi:hypothetical protein